MLSLEVLWGMLCTFSIKMRKHLFCGGGAVGSRLYPTRVQILVHMYKKIKYYVHPLLV